MLLYLTDLGAALLALSALRLTFGKKLTARVLVFVILASLAIAYSQVFLPLKNFWGMESNLCLGLMPIVAISWLCLLARLLKESFMQPHRLMILIATTGWLIGHSALWVAETTWLQPRFNAYQSTTYQWLGDQPASDQAIICATPSISCESKTYPLHISSGFHALQYETLVVRPLRVLSAVISCCWGLGFLVVMFGHRRKVRA